MPLPTEFILQPSSFRLWRRLRAALCSLAMTTLLAIPAPLAADLDFAALILPADRADESTGWFDINGDGRRDFVRQADRLLEAYLLDDRYQLAPNPSWRVQIAPPWDLWDFGDVRTDSPGWELLALSPNGVGWASYHQHTTSTAQMPLLIGQELPVDWDERTAQRGRYVLQLVKDRPADLLLPGRRGLQIFRRQPDGQWKVADELIAPLRPTPQFAARPSQSYLVGFGSRPTGLGIRTLDSATPGRMAWPEFRFRSLWSSPVGQLIDWNGDGRLDWMNEVVGGAKATKIFLQLPGGQFDQQNPIVPTFPGREKPAPEEKAAGQRQKERTEPGPEFLAGFGETDLRHLADVNGDGRLDFVRISWLDNWATPKTRIAVHLQTASGEFPKRPDSILRLGAVVPTDGLPMVDLDGDGDLDLLLLRLDLQIASVSSHVQAFMRQGLDTYLGAYLWHEGQGLATRPAWEKRVVITHDLFEFSRDPNPLMQFDHDLTGDHRPDLVLRLTRNTVGIFPLTDVKKGYAETAVATLRAPFAIEAIHCADLDGNGQTDVAVDGWDPADRDRAPRAVFLAKSPTSKGDAP